MISFIPLLLSLTPICYALPAPANPSPTTPTTHPNQIAILPIPILQTPSKITPHALLPRQTLLPGGERFTFTIPGGPTFTLGGSGYSFSLWEAAEATAAPLLLAPGLEERADLRERQGWVSSVLPVETDPAFGGYTFTVPDGGPTITLGGAGALSFTIGAVETAVEKV